MTEAEFVAALLDPSLPAPAGLVRPDGLAAPKRFAVYRNNVAVGLTEALTLAFPVVVKLVGATFFAAMAGEFLRRHPPKTRIMMLYGAEFPGFLAGFPPVAAYPYLADVARLEQSLREAYHAADMPAIDPALLAKTPEAELLACRIGLSPAMRLVRSPWPIHAIWRANSQGGPPPVARAEDVLVLRPDFDPSPHLLGPGGGDFMAALIGGAPLIEALSGAAPDFDLSALLALLLAQGAITGLHP